MSAAAARAAVSPLEPARARSAARGTRARIRAGTRTRTGARAGIGSWVRDAGSLSRLGPLGQVDRGHHPVEGAAQGRVVEVVPREPERLVRALQSGPRGRDGGRVLLVVQRLIELRLGGVDLCLGDGDRSSQVTGIDLRQHLALVHPIAHPDPHRGDLPGRGEGQIAGVAGGERAGHADRPVLGRPRDGLDGAELLELGSRSSRQRTPEGESHRGHHERDDQGDDDERPSAPPGRRVVFGSRELLVFAAHAKCAVGASPQGCPRASPRCWRVLSLSEDVLRLRQPGSTAVASSSGLARAYLGRLSWARDPKPTPVRLVWAADARAEPSSSVAARRECSCSRFGTVAGSLDGPVTATPFSGGGLGRRVADGAGHRLAATG